MCQGISFRGVKAGSVLDALAMLLIDGDGEECRGSSFVFGALLKGY